MTTRSGGDQETQRGTPSWAAPDVIPAIRCEDAQASVEWLERAFGFERHMVVEGDGNRIDHAQMRVGSGMVMLGSAREGDRFSARPPRELGALTASFYVIVDHPDAHRDRTRAAGRRW